MEAFLAAESKTDRWENIFTHDHLRNYLSKFTNKENKEDYEKLSFKYCSEDNFNNVTFSIQNHILKMTQFVILFSYFMFIVILYGATVSETA